jgi:hypothetical protein
VGGAVVHGTEVVEHGQQRVVTVAQALQHPGSAQPVLLGDMAAGADGRANNSA